MKRLLLGALLAVALCLGVFGTSGETAHAASGLHYQRGYSIQGSWLCYGWPNGAFHCTRHHNGFHSLNPGWVPNAGGASVRAIPVVSVGQRKPSQNAYPWGSCTYGAAALSHDIPNHLGNAASWFWSARSRGLPTGYSPRDGATVVYQPFVQGAGGLGHVAHVVRVYANGSFLVEEMNYYGYGGGFGRFSYRLSWPGRGVSFIY